MPLVGDLASFWIALISFMCHSTQFIFILTYLGQQRGSQFFAVEWNLWRLCFNIRYICPLPAVYQQITWPRTFLGKHCKIMLEKASTVYLVIAACFGLFAFICWWYIPLYEYMNHMQEIHDLILKVGGNERTYMALCMRLKFSFFQREQLSSLSQSFNKRLQSMVSTFNTYPSLLYSLLKC